MEIPIYIDGERTGTVSVTEEDGLTRLDARLRDPGRVVRLRIFGAREEWYLGVPEPEGEELRLLRRLSPARMRGFPENPLYAAESRRGKGSAGETVPPPKDGKRVVWLGGRPHYFQSRILGGKMV